MKLKFLGAAGHVTGSCHMLKVGDKTILLDCGMYQGRDEKEIANEELFFDATEIDYVILSHAHIDHSGRIPLLYKKGFKGQVICTEPTRELCNVMLPDSGHIQEMEVEWKNRKRIRQGLKPIEPLYTCKIAQLCLYLFVGHNYNEKIELFPGFTIRFRDAGHLLGSSIIEMFIKEENKEEVKLVYSGDLGNKDIPILKDPTIIDYADYVIMETTYGNRYHENINKELKQLVTIIKDTFKRGGNVIIPSFAVGRTQEIIYALNQYIENEDLKDIKVYVDSPLASNATKVFKKYEYEFDDEAQEIIKKGDDPLEFAGLSFTQSPEESATINKIQSGIIVVSASGMCEAGRIKHHLKHNLWRKESSIVFVGYQAEGTLGRSILGGAKKVKIFGEEIAVNAQIHNLQGLSGHADRLGLMSWLEGFKNKPKDVLLVHGDEEAQQSFKEAITAKGYKAKVVQIGESYIVNEAKADNDTSLKDKIVKTIDSFGDINELNKHILMERIKETLYE